MPQCVLEQLDSRYQMHHVFIETSKKHNINIMHIIIFIVAYIDIIYVFVYVYSMPTPIHVYVCLL